MHAVQRYSLQCASAARLLARSRHATLHTSSIRAKAFEMPVPKMGDSITEGTLLKVLKAPGQAVALDEIIAVIETDKVTVDVRAPEAGVVTAVHAKANDNVAVGAPLFSLDTEGKATVGSAAPAAPAAAAPTPAAAPAQSSPPSAQSHSVSASRKPSIHFKFGKRDAIDAELGMASSASPAQAGAAHKPSAPQAATQPASASFSGDWDEYVAKNFPSKAKTDYLDLPAHYRRSLPSTEAEMFVITSGGCEYVPPPPPKEGKKGK